MSLVQQSPSWLSLVDFRPAVRADLPALEWEGEYTHYRRVFKMAYRDTRSGASVLWLAVLPPSGEIIGQVFVQLRSSGRTELADGRNRAYLYAIRVKPDYRNAGLGTKMMDFVEGDLQAQGFRIATLNVAKDNSNARRFYTRRGYRIIGPEPGQWSYLDHRGRRRYVNEPAWRMEKMLE